MINTSFTLSQVVTSDADIMGGIPVFTGTRVPFKTLLDYVEAGDSLDEFLDHFPSVNRTQAIDALELIPVNSTRVKITANNADLRIRLSL